MKIFSKIFAALIAFIVFSVPTKIYAADAWAVAAESLGVYAAYKSALASMLRLGNNVDAQMAAMRQDIKENGTDKDKRDIEIVDKVMTRLVNNAPYELRVNSLPFIWHVNNSEKFNAACYPMNYITINRGLVKVFRGDENQLAAVLAHEMTHGIDQHSAKNYAKAIAQQIGAMMIGINVERGVDWNKLGGMVDYSIAKSIGVPTEYEADAGGFYLMTGAGFNPGGGAAAMARMGYYLRYETRDFMEFDAHDKPGEQTFSDHPETDLREQKLSAMMTDYSMGHVEVKKFDRQYKVFIDGEEIFTATNTSSVYNNAAENAYYFAGGLAKGFHEYDSAAGWKFRKGTAGRTDFLTGDKVYRQVRENALSLNLGERIRSLVLRAYENERAQNSRQKFIALENDRKYFWRQIKAEALSADSATADKLRLNADTYNDYGKGELALKQIERAMRAENQKDIPECFAIRGRAKAICGDYDGALADTNFAVEKDPSNLYNFLNRADVRRMRGESTQAIDDINRALKIDEKVAISHKLLAEIYDELGDKTKAEESYKNCYILTKKNPESIPQEYLEKIDPKAAEKLKKQKELAEKEKDGKILKVDEPEKNGEKKKSKK